MTGVSPAVLFGLRCGNPHHPNRASGENAPEDPTVDALFAAVDTYLSASGSADGMPEPCQPIGCDNGHHLPGCVYAAVDAGEAEQP